MTHGAPTKWPDLLRTVTQRLDRGGSPDSHFPDREGEYWALCPFHPDRHPENFSVSEAGYHCFACGASGGLWALAEKLGVAGLPHTTFHKEGGLRGAPRRGASRNRDAAGGVARLHGCSGRQHTPC
jgi:CHC2 zinc finger